MQTISRTETCPFCGSKINAGATVCTGCGAQKGIRGFPSGVNGLFVFCLLWLGPSGLIIVGALKGFNKPSGSYETGMGAPTLLGLLLLGSFIFLVGLALFRRLWAKASDVIWVR